MEGHLSVMKVVFKQHLFVKESDVGTLIFRKDETTKPAKSSMTHGAIVSNGYTVLRNSLPSVMRLVKYSK